MLNNLIFIQLVEVHFSNMRRICYRRRFICSRGVVLIAVIVLLYQYFYRDTTITENQSKVEQRAGVLHRPTHSNRHEEIQQKDVPHKPTHQQAPNFKLAKRANNTHVKPKKDNFKKKSKNKKLIGILRNCSDIDALDRGCYCVTSTGFWPPTYRILDEFELERRDCKLREPSAIILGSMKCGTAALNAYLSLHPQIATPLQELHYLHRNDLDDLDDYRSLMPYSTPSQVPLERTAGYLIHEIVAKRIEAALPKTKFILIFRDPINRAISLYVHLLARNATKLGGDPQLSKNSSSGYEVLSTFEESVLFKNGSVKEHNRILFSGLYVKYLRKWFGHFPKEQFLILDGETFVKEPIHALRQTERFLGIKPYFNESFFYFDDVKQFICVNKPFKMCMSKGKGRKHPEIKKEILGKLQNYFRTPNKELVELLNTTFSWIPDGEEIIPTQSPKQGESHSPPDNNNRPSQSPGEDQSRADEIAKSSKQNPPQDIYKSVSCSHCQSYD